MGGRDIHNSQLKHSKFKIGTLAHCLIGTLKMGGRDIHNSQLKHSKFKIGTLAHCLIGTLKMGGGGIITSTHQQIITSTI
jgi:hypothetical protein